MFNFIVFHLQNSVPLILKPSLSLSSLYTKRAIIIIVEYIYEKGHHYHCRVYIRRGPM